MYLEIGICFIVQSLSSQILCAQETDSLIFKRFSNLFSNEYSRPFDTLVCEEHIQLARSNVEADSLFVPHSLLFFSETHKKMLLIDYDLKERKNIGGDVVRSETACFDLIMEAAIKKKWGDDFFIKTKIIADSLEKSGLGFKGPSFNGNESEDLFIKNNFAKIDIFKNHALVGIVIDFLINSDGSVSDLRLYIDTTGSNSFNKIDDRILERQIETIFNKMKWNPAKFKGTGIAHKKHLFISRSNFN